MTSRVWKDADGNQINDEQLYAWIKQEQGKLIGDHALVVGVDSQRHGHTFVFVTSVCVYHKGRGGFYYYTTARELSKEYKGTYQTKVRARLFRETEMAIQTGLEVLEHTECVPIIHVDASPPGSPEVTAMFSDQLRGYVVASGFECALKPYSFAATGISNKHAH